MRDRIGLAAAMLLLAGCGGRPSAPAGWQDIGSFGDFRPPATPAHYLACPPQYCFARPDRLMPLFAMPADRLRVAVRRALDAEPDAELLTSRDEGLRLVYRQHGGWRREGAVVTVGVVDADVGISGIALYSQSDASPGDPDEERERATTWLEAIGRAAAAEALSGH